MLIENLIPGTNLETKDTEFKGIIEEGKKPGGGLKEIGWLKTIAAFANTDGGRLFVGVEDKTHKIVALDHETSDQVVRMVHRQIRERLEPKIDYDISSINVPDTSPIRYVLCITVKKSRQLPVSLHEAGLLGIYVRNYGQTETATPEQIRDMVMMSENIPYDAPFTDIPFRKKDFSKMYSVAKERSVELTDKALISIGFMSGEKKLSKGALLFKDDCSDSVTRVSMSLWPGYDKGSDVVLADKVYEGNLIDLIQNATVFIKEHSANGYRKTADSRVQFIAYPERSITEGIVNAVAHRNYFIYGAQIEINIFKDRLEITSPGSLLGVRRLDKEKDIASIIPRRRNEVICSTLSMLDYMEEKGSGFDKIESDYADSDENHRPYVSCDDSSFTLTLPDMTYGSGVSLNEDDIPEVYAMGTLSGKNDLSILAFCYNSPHSVSEIADYLGMTPSTYFRKNTIKRLVNNGFLTEKIAGRKKQYQSDREKVLKK